MIIQVVTYRPAGALGFVDSMFYTHVAPLGLIKHKT